MWYADCLLLAIADMRAVRGLSASQAADKSEGACREDGAPVVGYLIRGYPRSLVTESVKRRG